MTRSMLMLVAAMAALAVPATTTRVVEDANGVQRLRYTQHLSRSKRNKKARKERLKAARRNAFEGK